MTTQINAKTEKALREALHSVTLIGDDQIPPSLAALDDDQRTAAVGLALIITGYIMIDACGSQWPTQASVQRIARTLATKSTNAERLHLDPEKIYAYLSRTVLGPEQLEDVVPDEPEFTRLPMVVAGEALAVFGPKEMDIWDYLDRIETGIERASMLDAIVLPAAVMRAYLSSQSAPGQ